MRELLADNVAVRRHFEEVHGALGFQVVPVSPRPRVREVTTLPSWITCFLTFLAVSTTDAVTRDRLAYAILIVREAMRHGGQGWLEYDRLFRQQACLNPSLPWNVIHPGLQATTILGQQPVGSGTSCSLCRECDHVVSQCALAQLQPQIIRSSNPTRSGTGLGRICSSWNDGACTYPGTCTYRHVCSNCFQASHPARSCRLPPRSRAGANGTVARPSTSVPRTSSA